MYSINIAAISSRVLIFQEFLRPGVHEVQEHFEVMLANFLDKTNWIKRCIQFDFLLPIAYIKRGLKTAEIGYLLGLDIILCWFQ